MRRRFVTAMFLVIAGFGLGACEQMADLIPDSKKPLPGERKLLFPEGVPGVTQGVPPELMTNSQQANQQPQGQPGAPANAQPAQQQAEEKPKPKPKPKVQRAARQQPAQEQTEPAQPQQQQTSPWPSQQQQPAQSSPWPSAPAPGTFTR